MSQFKAGAHRTCNVALRSGLNRYLPEQLTDNVGKQVTIEGTASDDDGRPLRPRQPLENVDNERDDHALNWMTG
jgi:hypothetical protein